MPKLNSLWSTGHQPVGTLMSQCPDSVLIITRQPFLDFFTPQALLILELPFLELRRIGDADAISQLVHGKGYTVHGQQRRIGLARADVK